MPDNPTFLAERLLAEGYKSVQFFRDLPAQSWDKVIYMEGTAWKAIQMLAHFTASELSLFKLLENILGGGSGSPEDFDINLFNERKVAQLAHMDADTLLVEFINQREKTSHLVNQMTMADLERQGRHPYLGVSSLAEIIKIIYRHNQIHQREMRKALGENE
jgi:hypothetical protein